MQLLSRHLLLVQLSDIYIMYNTFDTKQLSKYNSIFNLFLKYGIINSLSFFKTTQFSFRWKLSYFGNCELPLKNGNNKKNRYRGS
jgi:hypothetical protein